MTPEQAADARRSKKEELERQLAALDEEDRYYERASQPPDLARERDHTYPGSSSYPSRNDVISPPWPQTAVSAGTAAWNSAITSTGGHSRNRTAPSAFQPLPDPTPMKTSSSSATSGQAPWQTSAASTSRRPNEMYIPSPDLHSRQPRMPNPFSASFVNIPVPSKEQVDVYLVRAQNLPHGLRTGWTISNHSRDVYDLFVAVVRLGGAKAVSRRHWWPELADTLGIPGVNSPQGRNIVESGRKLYTFFTTHLGPLEDMWDQTSGTAEDAGLAQVSSIDNHTLSRLASVRQPVSATRGGHEDELSQSWTRTYPPQPPPPSTTRDTQAQSSSSRTSGSSESRQPSETGLSSTVPLHFNPVDISTRRTTDRQQSATNNDYYQRYPYAASSQDAPSSSHSHAQAPSLSPVIHHPIPAALGQQHPNDHAHQYSSATTSNNTTPNLPAATLPTSASRRQPANPPAVNATAARQAQTATNGKSKAFTFPSLTNYNPPKFASFDHLVQTNALTLPKLPPNVHLDYFGTASEIYAKRCFELRSVVKKIQSKEPARQISVDEMTFWQKLLAILRHNPQVIIPGHQPMSTENAPAAPTTSTSNVVLTQMDAGPSIPSVFSGQGADQPPKKKRGRPRKDLDGGVEPSQPKKRGRPRNERILNVDPSDERDLAVAGPSAAAPTTVTTAIDPRLLMLETDQQSRDAVPGQPASSLHGQPQTDSHETADPQASASANGDSHAEHSGKKPRKPWTTRTNPDGTPVTRKPYTIRLNPDGTPVSDRFKKRVSSGNPGRVSYITPPPDGPEGTAGPSNSQPGVLGDDDLNTIFQSVGVADAMGEIDYDTPPKSLQEAIEAAKQAQAQLARVLAAHQTPAPSGQTLPSQGETSGKNPRRVEAARQAALRRWGKVRQEKEALGLPINPLSGPRAQPASTPAPATSNVSARAATATSSAGPSASQPAPAAASRGGFSVPGAAKFAAQKRWSLHHAGSSSNGSGRQATPADLAHINAVRPGSVKPAASVSPRRVFSLSGSQPTPGSSGQSAVTPTRRIALDQGRDRAASMRPRSSLPLFLTPAPRRYFAHAESEADGEEDVADTAGPPDDLADDDYEVDDEKEEAEPRVTRGAASRAKDTPSINTRSRPKGRASLPSTLSRAPLSTRSDKGKGVARRGSLVDPSPRSVLTRNLKTRGEFTIATRRSSSHEPPSGRITRAASAMPARSTQALQVVDPASPVARPRRSLPSASAQRPSSQGQSRLVPEIELVVPARPTSESPLKITPRSRPRLAVETKPRIVPKPRPKPKPKIVPKARSSLKSAPKRSRPVIKEPRVVLRINRRRRLELIDSGAYDIFKDDDSEEEAVLQRQGHAGLRKIALSRTSLGRTARPTAPEAIPVRFFSRGGPALVEPFKSILDQTTILKRACAHECQWKGCDSVLASEWHLRQHFETRRHAEQGAFKAGIYGDNTLYRCHWVECEKPCFTSLAALEQHLTARHISRTLACPWPDCDLRFSTISHLTRHAVKHHDSPDDHPRPLADVTERSKAPGTPDQPLPAEVPADTLIMPTVHGSTYSSVYRREWCRLKVHKGSIAPPNPSLVPHRRPHILEVVGEDPVDEDVSDSESLYTTLDGGAVTEERLLDESTGRSKRRLFPVVDIRVGKLANAGWYQDPTGARQKPSNKDEPIVIDEALHELDAAASPQPRARFNLSESVHEDETRKSESEVWAELEDDAVETAFTPAGFPAADFDLNLLDDRDADEAGPSQVGEDEAELDALVHETFSTPAGFLGVDPDNDAEEGEARSEASVRQVDEPVDVDGLPIWDGQLETMPAGLLGPATGPDVQAADAHNAEQGAEVQEEVQDTRAMSAEAVDLDAPVGLELDVNGREHKGGQFDDQPPADADEAGQDGSPSADEVGETAVPEFQSEIASTAGLVRDSTVPDFSGLFGNGKSPSLVETEKPLEAAAPVTPPVTAGSIVEVEAEAADAPPNPNEGAADDPIPKDETHDSVDEANAIDEEQGASTKMTSSIGNTAAGEGANAIVAAASTHATEPTDGTGETAVPTEGESELPEPIADGQLLSGEVASTTPVAVTAETVVESAHVAITTSEGKEHEPTAAD